jgi:DNA topoisomerase III
MVTLFKTKGRVLLEEGWRKVIPNTKSSISEEDQSIPELKENEKIKCESINVLESKTTPPKRLTSSLMEQYETYIIWYPYN